LTIAVNDDEEVKDAFRDEADEEKDFEKYMEIQIKIFETLDEGTKKEAE
jgi:hypothetical protein